MLKDRDRESEREREMCQKIVKFHSPLFLVFYASYLKGALGRFWDERRITIFFIDRHIKTLIDTDRYTLVTLKVFNKMFIRNELL